MGTGSSNPRKVNRIIQVPSPSRVLPRTPSPVVIIRPASAHRRPHSSQPSPWLVKTQKHHFNHHHQQHSNSDLSSYASIWERNGKLSSKFQQLIRSDQIKVEHHQKEMNHSEKTTIHNSKCNGAVVESILKSEVDTTHSLSTSERLDSLIANLKETHNAFDQSVKERIGQITIETESILAQIVEETQENQQNLLLQAKQQQIVEDEQYRSLLEEFLRELDEKRAKQLALMQEYLQEQRLEIFNQSELKVRALNEQANSLKNLIMSEEERKASEKIEHIVTEINAVTTESALHDIQTEIATNIHLTVIEKGQTNRTLDHEHSFKRTTFLDTNLKHSSSSSTVDNLKTNQLTKQNPTNPKKKP